MTESLYLLDAMTSYRVHELAGSRMATLLGGIGMPPVAHVTQRGPRQDGDTLLDVKLEPREVTVGILQQQDSRLAFWHERRALLDMLRRFEGLKLRLVLEDAGESFDLDVAYAAGAELGTDGSVGLRDFAAAIRLIAHDPTWYASAPTSLVVGIPTLGGAGVFPRVYPIVFGMSYINADIALQYLGTWRAYPQIDVRGPITNPVIENLSTGEKLELAATVPNGQVVRFDLGTNVKTVVNLTTGANWMPYLTNDSDLATWHLGVDPEVVGNMNALHLFGTAGGANTVITLRWHDRYIGV